jgi:hypothetical protein
MVLFPVLGEGRKLFVQVNINDIKDSDIKIKRIGISKRKKNYILTARKIVEQILESSEYGQTVNSNK